MMSNTHFVNYITKDFCIALGQSKTIENLYFDSITAATSSDIMNMLAKACAMNKKKNGSLNYISLKKLTTFDTRTFNRFFESFMISE